MKTLSLFAITVLITAVSTPLIAQQTINSQPGATQATNAVSIPSYRMIRQLTCGQTTEQDIRTLLGKPISIGSGSKMTEWAYRFDKLDIVVQFDAENKLTTYLYQLRNARNLSGLNMQKIKSIQVGDSEVDLFRSLGDPTFLSMTPSRMDLMYDNAADRTQLQVVLTKTGGFAVKEFQFTETARRPLVIDSDKLTGIKNGKTTLAEVTSLFGEPTQKVISLATESWYYEAADSKLSLQFNRKPIETVAAYQYDLKHK